MSLPPRPLRTHQAQTAALVHAIADGRADEITDILAAVTPGGGKSLLPVIAAAGLLAAGVALYENPGLAFGVGSKP